MKEIIFKFIENNIQYIVYKENDKYIPCKNINNDISFDLDDDELNMVSTVFDKLKVTNNQVKLSNIKFENKEYQHFYDKTNDWNIFLNIDGSDITKEELSLFNNLFNYQDDKMYMASNIEQNNNLIKRLINFGKKTIVALVLSTSLISPLSNLTTVQGKEIKTETVVVEKEEKEELSAYQKIENFKNSINNNENLSKEEKEFVLSRFDIIYDNIDLINYDLVNKRFESLRIEYEDDICKDGTNTAAYYSPIDNLIHIYNASGFEDVDSSTLTHELFHALQGKNISYSGFYEPLNDILVNEYQGVNEMKEYRNYSWGYNSMKPYIYLLMELVNPESFRYYNFTGDESKIKSDLMNIIDDESKYYELRSSLEALFSALINKNKSSIRPIAEDSIKNILGEYVEAKSNKSRYSNVDYVMNIYPSIFKSVLINNGIDYIQEPGKIYFNNKYKDKNSENYYIKKRISNKDNLNYLETIKYLKKQNTINNQEYKELKKEYKLYKNKKINLRTLNDYILDNGYEFYIDSRTNKVIYYNIYENKKLDKNILDGKEDDVKGQIILSDNIFNRNIKYNEIINLKDFILESRENKLYVQIGNKSYTLDSEYSEEIIKYLNDLIIHNRENLINFSINGKVLSVWNIAYSADDKLEKSIYNINLKTASKVSLKQLLKTANVTKEDVINQALLDYQLMLEDKISDFKTPEEFELIVKKNMDDFNKEYIYRGYINEKGELIFDIKLDTGDELIDGWSIVIGSPYEKEDPFDKAVG